MGQAFIKAAAAAGVTRLGTELEELAGLEAAHGREALVSALAGAVEFSRYKAADVRSILAAGKGALPVHASGGDPAQSLTIEVFDLCGPQSGHVPINAPATPLLPR